MKDLSNENVIHVKKNGVEYLQFRKLLEYSDIIKHAYAIGLEPNFRTARAKNATPLTKEEYEKAKEMFYIVDDEALNSKFDRFFSA